MALARCPRAECLRRCAPLRRAGAALRPPAFLVGEGQRCAASSAARRPQPRVGTLIVRTKSAGMPATSAPASAPSQRPPAPLWPAVSSCFPVASPTAKDCGGTLGSSSAGARSGRQRRAPRADAVGLVRAREVECVTAWSGRSSTTRRFIHHTYVLERAARRLRGRKSAARSIAGAVKSTLRRDRAFRRDLNGADAS